MIIRLTATSSPFLFFPSIFRNCSVSLKSLIPTFLDRLALSTSFTVHNRPIYFVCRRARHVWLGARSSFQESITRPPKATFFDRKAKLFNRQVRAAVRSRQPSSIRPSTDQRLVPAFSALGSAPLSGRWSFTRIRWREMRDFMVVMQSCVIGGPQPANKADKRANAASILSPEHVSVRLRIRVPISRTIVFPG